MTKADERTRMAPPCDPDLVPAPTRRAGRSPLGTLEAFVLARVDGRRTVADIAALVSLSLPEVASILGRLSELGSVHIDSAPDSLSSEDLDTIA